MKPFEMLEQHVGKRVIVQMKDGAIVTGVLEGWDVHLNIVLNDALLRGDPERKLGKILLRGDNIFLISPE